MSDSEAVVGVSAGSASASVAGMRRAYDHAGLSETDLAAGWLDQFSAWFSDAVGSGLLAEPNAMMLATATPDGRPSGRTVLLKGFDQDGFVFFTNYSSRKGGELAANPRAALVFPWYPLHRQVIVEGPVARVSRAETAGYFATRPRGSQLGAWASPQSTVVAGREPLDAAYAAAEARWSGADIPPPEHWGGLRIAPDNVEFWQGRSDRLHDRLRYRRTPDAGWLIERLAP